MFRSVTMELMHGWRGGAILAGLLSLCACTGDRPRETKENAPVSSAPPASAGSSRRTPRVPQPQVATAGAQSAAAGATARLVLRVSLPAGLHVQSHAPTDENLIGTVLNVTAPDGVSIVDIEYPKAVDFIQGTQLLTVYESEFDIVVTVRVAAPMPRGPIVIPAELRYQACNDTVCFAPASVRAEWPLQIT